MLELYTGTYMESTQIIKPCINVGASLVAQMVKNPPEMQETQVWILGQEDPSGSEQLSPCATNTEAWGL